MPENLPEQENRIFSVDGKPKLGGYTPARWSKFELVSSGFGRSDEARPSLPRRLNWNSWPASGRYDQSARGSVWFCYLAEDSEAFWSWDTGSLLDPAEEVSRELQVPHG